MNYKSCETSLVYVVWTFSCYFMSVVFVIAVTYKQNIICYCSCCFDVLICYRFILKCLLRPLAQSSITWSQ